MNKCAQAATLSLVGRSKFERRKIVWMIALVSAFAGSVFAAPLVPIPRCAPLEAIRIATLKLWLGRLEDGELERVLHERIYPVLWNRIATSPQTHAALIGPGQSAVIISGLPSLPSDRIVQIVDVSERWFPWIEVSADGAQVLKVPRSFEWERFPDAGLQMMRFFFGTRPAGDAVESSRLPRPIQGSVVVRLFNFLRDQGRMPSGESIRLPVEERRLYQAVRSAFRMRDEEFLVELFLRLAERQAAAVREGPNRIFSGAEISALQSHFDEDSSPDPLLIRYLAEVDRPTSRFATEQDQQRRQTLAHAVRKRLRGVNGPAFVRAVERRIRSNQAGPEVLRWSHEQITSLRRGIGQVQSESVAVQLLGWFLRYGQPPRRTERPGHPLREGEAALESASRRRITGPHATDFSVEIEQAILARFSGENFSEAQSQNIQALRAYSLPRPRARAWRGRDERVVARFFRWLLVAPIRAHPSDPRPGEAAFYQQYRALLRSNRTEFQQSVLRRLRERQVSLGPDSIPEDAIQRIQNAAELDSHVQPR